MEDSWAGNFKRNQQWIKPGNHVYNTALNPQQEQQFRQWLGVRAQNPQDLGAKWFNPSDPVGDYDLRGFWLAQQAGDPRAREHVMDDGKVHRDDYWKTPYHESFSIHSQWATPDAPRWDGDRYISSTGALLHDYTPPATKPDLSALKAGAAAKMQALTR